jgi:uncharacterized protein YqhQ
MSTTEPAPKKLRLGGMALRNGLLVHGPTHWAAAVRTPSGAVKVASGKKPRLRGPVDRLPGARGVARLGEALVVIPLVKQALPEARLPFQDATVLSTMAGAALAGTLLRRRTSGGLAGEAALAAVSLAPSLMALRGGDLAAYHGVEHKAIAAYEDDDADARDAAKEHDRCGSHLMAPMLTANVAGTVLLKRLVDRPTTAQGAALSLASIGLAVEVFSWTERHSETGTARALRRPGFELQRVLGTREPTEDQLAVGRAALEEILRVEGAAA